MYARKVTRLKGTNLVHTRAYVESSFGLEGWATVAAGMSRESRAAIDSVIAVGWYPASLHVELLHAIDTELDQKKGVLLQHAAAYGAEYDFTRIHRVLFRLSNPGFLLERVGDIWTRFYARRLPTSVSSIRDTARTSARTSCGSSGSSEHGTPSWCTRFAAQRGMRSVGTMDRGAEALDAIREVGFPGQHFSYFLPLLRRRAGPRGASPRAGRGTALLASGGQRGTVAARRPPVVNFSALGVFATHFRRLSRIRSAWIKVHRTRPCRARPWRTTSPPSGSRFNAVPPATGSPPLRFALPSPIVRSADMRWTSRRSPADDTRH